MNTKRRMIYMFILWFIWIYSVIHNGLYSYLWNEILESNKPQFHWLERISVKRCVIFVAFFQWTTEAPLATARTTCSRYLATWAARTYKMFMWELTENAHVEYHARVYNSKCSLRYLRWTKPRGCFSVHFVRLYFHWFIITPYDHFK